MLCGVAQALAVPVVVAVDLGAVLPQALAPAQDIADTNCLQLSIADFIVALCTNPKRSLEIFTHKENVLPQFSVTVM